MDTYPTSPEPSWSYQTQEQFKTLVSEFDSGAEQRRSLRRFSKRSFSLIYNVKTVTTDWIALHDFFKTMLGGWEAFWFYDPCTGGVGHPPLRKWTDEYVGRGLCEAPQAGYLWNGATFSDFTTQLGNATANDVTLLDATPVEEDCFYFRMDSLSGMVGDTLRLNIGTAGVGVWVITWEYWDGDSWDEVASLVDGTTGFTVAGTNNVTFDPPFDWAVCTVNSVSGYWLRARLSSYTNMPAQPLGTQGWIGKRFYDLHSKDTVEDATLKIYYDAVEKTKDADWFFGVGTEALLNGNFEDWVNPTNAADWTEFIGGASTINQDNAVFHAGLYSARFDINGGSALLEQIFNLIPGRTYVFKFWHKESINGSSVRRIDLRTSDAALFLKEDGTWNTGAYFLNYPRSTTWTEVEIKFVAPEGYTTFIVYPYADNVDDDLHSIWFDDISVIGIGEAGADRIRSAALLTNGALITSNFTGNLRIKGVMDDQFGDEIVTPDITNISAVKVREVQW